MESADVLIVGAGIAGLYSGVQLLRRRPGSKVVIVEKYKTLGGRVITFRGKDGTAAAGMHWENGAGRVHSTHRRVRHLLREHGLHLAPIGASAGFMRGAGYGIETNDFEDLIATYLAPLRLLGAKALGATTLGKLLEEIHGETQANEIIVKFPYHAEIWVQRADMALEALCGDLGTREGYGVCVEGLGALIAALADTFRGLGGEVVADCEVEQFERIGGEWIVEAFCGRKWTCVQLVLAVHASAIGALKSSLTACGADVVMAAAERICMERLLRIYAIYPKGSPMLRIPRLVVPGGLRYIIPVDPERGVVMISYTEGKDTEPWWKDAVAAASGDKKGLKHLTWAIDAEVKRLFPGVKVPAPLFVKAHPWTSGCSYWLPGDYDPQELGRQILNPVSGLYVCGESWSMHQAWMEGALESADEMLSTLLVA
jgi:glycine/D-amino acid oxidase-like deaminating enzyme